VARAYANGKVSGRWAGRTIMTGHE
jgi:hypothetical protein